jgi:hypothetical protein
LNSDSDTFGVAQIPATGVTPSAVIVNLSDILAMPIQKMNAFSMRTMQQLVIAMPSALQNPSKKDLDIALNTVGVNTIPLDIFSDSLANVKTLVGEYSSMSYKPIPIALRALNVA